MGICYTLIMQDEWNWGYLEETKDKTLKEFEDKFRKLDYRYIERIAEWTDYVVYDIDKASIYSQERLQLIRDYCDCAHYYSDIDSTLRFLSLPPYKSKVKEEIDNMASRRTPEEKKASEDLVRERLKKMNTDEMVSQRIF